MSKIQDAAIECMEILKKAGAANVLVFGDADGGCSTTEGYRSLLAFLNRCQDRIQSTHTRIAAAQTGVTQISLATDRDKPGAGKEDYPDKVFVDCAKLLKAAGFDEIAIYAGDKSVVMARVEQAKEFVESIIAAAQVSLTEIPDDE